MWQKEPAKDYYDPEGMSEVNYIEFTTWHDALVAENYVFIFREKLVAYCQSDVRLLKEGCQRFQKEFDAEAGFNPFLKMHHHRLIVHILFVREMVAALHHCG